MKSIGHIITCGKKDGYACYEVFEYSVNNNYIEYIYNKYKYVGRSKYLNRLQDKYPDAKLELHKGDSCANISNRLVKINITDLTVLPIGRYSGKKITNVDKNYLCWLYNDVLKNNNDDLQICANMIKAHLISNCGYMEVDGKLVNKSNCINYIKIKNYFNSLDKFEFTANKNLRALQNNNSCYSQIENYVNPCNYQYLYINDINGKSIDEILNIDDPTNKFNVILKFQDYQEYAYRDCYYGLPVVINKKTGKKTGKKIKGKKLVVTDFEIIGEDITGINKTNNIGLLVKQWEFVK